MDTKLKFSQNDLIMEQFSHGESAYIIEEGQVEIFIIHPGDEEQVLSRRGEGAIIGEMALVDQKQRTASVRAVTNCVLIQITKEDFQRRLKSSDPIIRMVTQVILNRYRDTLSRIHAFDTTQPSTDVENTEREITGSGKAIDHLKTANEFKHAISNDELMLYYQPIIDLETKKVEGFEALMRWNHPEKGFMPPNLFIPIAEDSGLIIEASNWAMKQAAKTIKTLRDRTGDDTLFMAVNFTAIDMLHPDFLEKLKNACEQENIPHNAIKIEMTERLLMNNPEKVRAMLKECREAGFSIAIDDFGTGYSSLSYLHHYPIDTLKIDRSFVVQMTKDTDALNLVKGIINLAKSLNMSLVAEGIEKDHEEALLLKSNCEMAQGYKYAKPMAEDSLLEWLSSHTT